MHHSGGVESSKLGGRIYHRKSPSVVLNRVGQISEWSGFVTSYYTCLAAICKPRVNAVPNAVPVHEKKKGAVVMIVGVNSN